MFKTIRASIDSLKMLNCSLEMLAAALLTDVELRTGDGDLEERVREIENSRNKWEAQVEGLLLKAKGQYKAAAASEGRAKTREAHTAKLNDGGVDDEFMEEYAEYLRQAGVPLRAGEQDTGAGAELRPGRRAGAKALRRARRGG